MLRKYIDNRGDVVSHHEVSDADSRITRSSEVGLVRKGNERQFVDSLHNRFSRLGIQAKLDSSRESIVTMNAEVLAIPVEIDYKNADEFDDGEESWVRATLLDNKIEYRLSHSGQLLETRNYTETEKFEVSISVDSAQKSVTARSASAHAGELGLPFRDVFPKQSDIAVIGDPYQKVDLDGVSIIDYEFADEIIPDIRGFIAKLDRGEWGFDELLSSVKQFFSALHPGNDMAIRNVHGSFSPYRGNPYAKFVEECNLLVAEYIYAMGDSKKIDALSRVIPKMQRRFTDLRLGNWTIEDYAEKFHDEHDPAEALAGLEIYYSIKEDSIRADRTAWNNYIKSYEAFLARVPGSAIADLGLEDDVESVRHWINEVPKISSNAPGRLQEAINTFDRVYNKIVSTTVNHPAVRKLAAAHRGMIGIDVLHDGEYLGSSDAVDNENISEEDVLAYLVDNRISDTGSTGIMSDSHFGLGTPGIPINHRVSGYLEEMVDFLNRMDVYARNIIPVLKNEKSRIVGNGIDFDNDAMEYYISSLERAFIREQLHRKRTSHANVIHGFFPEGMKNGLNEMDRIIGVYSISTHVWAEYSSPAEFEDNLREAISFLKPGGKMMVGPLNYRAYRIWQRSGDLLDNYEYFDGDSLNSALSSLRDEGLIRFSFLVPQEQVMEYNSSLPALVQTEEFGTGDIAASLVVERL